MNLYSRKQQWKALLLILAVVIVGLSLWYSNHIVSKIRQDERQKVQLWSEAVKKRLTLINYTQQLFTEMRSEERNKIDLWAKATERLITTTENDELLFLQEIITKNTTIPVLVADENNNVQFHRNVQENLLSSKSKSDSLIRAMASTYVPIKVRIMGIEQYLYYQDSRIITELEKTLDDLVNSFITETVMNSGSVPVLVTDASQTQVLNFSNIDSTIVSDSLLLKRQLAEMSEDAQPIEVQFGDDVASYVFYTDSVIIAQLQYFPVVQFIMIGLFLFIAYLIFSTFRNAEQNQVWIGMAKETAHQLGTPLSSLMAWIQLLEARGTDKETINELNKDIRRLEMITDRFSKIGSNPELKSTSVLDVMNQTVSYLRPRISDRVVFHINPHEAPDSQAMINEPLFSWVIENIFKNAVDAMSAEGEITVDIFNEIQNVYIDITDTGKGISGNNLNAVFQPGFTTKKRGWGLGLSLAKRIIENYHNGRIFVKRSEPGFGTTFRIVLKTKP